MNRAAGGTANGRRLVLRLRVRNPLTGTCRAYTQAQPGADSPDRVTYA